MRSCLESFVIHRMREEGWRGIFVVLGLDDISREVGRSSSNTWVVIVILLSFIYNTFGFCYRMSLKRLHLGSISFIGISGVAEKPNQRILLWIKRILRVQVPQILSVFINGCSIGKCGGCLSTLGLLQEMFGIAFGLLILWRASNSFFSHLLDPFPISESILIFFEGLKLPKNLLWVQNDKL